MHGQISHPHLQLTPKGDSNSTPALHEDKHTDKQETFSKTSEQVRTVNYFFKREFLKGNFLSF